MTRLVGRRKLPLFRQSSRRGWRRDMAYNVALPFRSFLFEHQISQILSCTLLCPCCLYCVLFLLKPKVLITLPRRLSVSCIWNLLVV